MPATPNTDTQHHSQVPICAKGRVSVFCAQWLLEQPEDHKPYSANNLDVFICGEDAFKQIAADLKAAKHSVEIICWGFDPGMELTRTGTSWPRGDTWGELLRDVAAGKYNAGKPVQVRLLSWYGLIGSTTPVLGANNMPGYSKDSRTYQQRMQRTMSMSGPGGVVGARHLASHGKLKPQSPQDKRTDFNARWYQDAFGGQIPNVAIRTRDGDSQAVAQSLASEKGKRGAIEDLVLKQAATDHQKTILIDYEHEGGAHAVGYVMGLNSVTDYWDTQQHLFHDPRRGDDWEGHSDKQPGLKPLQDYACRIRGEALVGVSHNFTVAWNRAKGKGPALARKHDLNNPPTGLTANLGSPLQRAQIVRTQPEESDKTIKRLYQQATSFARDYIYIENQYFQHTEWATELKTLRASYAKAWQAAGRSTADLPNLHVMAVIPTPELAQMVPRTYDTVKALGQGSSMPNQDKAIEDEIQQHRAQMQAWDAYVARQKASGLRPRYELHPVPLSAAAQSAHDLGEKENITKALEQMGMRTLVGSLWSFDKNWRGSKLNRETEAKRADWEDRRARWDAQVKAQEARGETPDWEMTPLPPPMPLQDELLAARYREIYIHSKLLLIDDSFFTLGSANLNLRSMAVDAEINVGTDDQAKSEDLRKRVWKLHTGGAPGCNPATLNPKTMADAFDKWTQLVQKNAVAKDKGNEPTGFLQPFQDKRISRMRLG